MNCGSFVCALIAALALSVPAIAQMPAAGKNLVTIRGQQQEIYFYPAASSTPTPHRKILFAPGDGGWRGFAITIAETAASWGYDVYGLDTRRYLEGFTTKTSALKETDVMADFGQIAEWITRSAGERVVLVGWSEGAGLCLLAAAAEENKKRFSGLVTIGLGETNVLGWRLSDYWTYLTKKDPKEPMFASVPYLPKVSPLPLVMLQASQDEYVPVDVAKRLVSMAEEPKQFALLEAQNHRFDGNREGFFRALRDGLVWINQKSP